MSYDDDRLLAVVRQELRAILESRPRRCSTGFNAGSAPTHSTMSGIRRWSSAIEASLPDGMYVTGSAFAAWGCPTASIRRSKRPSGCWNARNKTPNTSPQETLWCWAQVQPEVAQLRPYS
ncbi:MAG: hypothetical protein U0703_06235 [Anaerolineae bacterium]